MPCSLVPQDVSAASFGCRESQSYVVGHPVSIGIAKLGFQDRPNLLQIVAASFVGEALKKVESKSFQVTNDVARQGSWTWDQRNAIDTKPCAFQPGGVVAGCGEIPRNASLAIKPTAVQCLNQSGPDLVNATWPPHSATNRPPGFKERYTPASITSARLVQCRTALLNAAFNSSLYASSSPLIADAFKPSFLAASICGTLESTATTSQPRSASFFVSTPS